jgi:hypothetical protein
MTSCGPYSQSYNMTWKFDPVTPRKNCKRIYNPNSITGFLDNPLFSKFKTILTNSSLEEIYADEQANFTLFVVPDTSLTEFDFKGINEGTAKKIMRLSTLNYKITIDVLQTSETLLLYPHIGRILIQNNLPGQINVIGQSGEASVIGSISLSNGIIHIINNFII